MTYYYQDDTVTHLREQIGFQTRWATNNAARRDAFLARAQGFSLNRAESEELVRQAAEAEAAVQRWTARIADNRRLLALIQAEHASGPGRPAAPVAGPAFAPDVLREAEHLLEGSVAA